jgi:glycosyltransferase involved in cell wall biosynthesis
MTSSRFFSTEIASMDNNIDSSVPIRGLPRLLIVGSFLPGFELERYAGGALANRLMQGGGKVITTSHMRSRPVRLVDMLFTTFERRRDYDVAHITVFSGLAFFYAECVAKLLSFLGKPYTLSLHGGNLPDFASRHPARIARLFSQASLVVCPSGYLYEKLKPLKPDMHLIPNAVDVSKYPLNLHNPVGVRLLWLRAFHRIYNPMMAPLVLARLLETMPQAQLTMVGPDKGDGSYEATKRAATGLGVLDRIKFAGPVPKGSVAQVLSEHDIFLNTTNVDNTPVSVIEAMACGLPIVSTNVGGISYLLEHGKTALLVQPGNAEEMAGAVKRIFSQPELARRLAENGRRLAESFDWQVVLPQWESLFIGLMAEAPR